MLSINNVINTHYVNSDNTVDGMDAVLSIINGRYIVDDGESTYEIDHIDLGYNLGDLVIFEDLPVVIQDGHIYTPAILQVCDGDSTVCVFAHAGIAITYSVDGDGVYIVRNFVNMWDQDLE